MIASSPAAAQDADPAAPQGPATVGLDAFSMLIGHWRGEGFGGVTEEFWTRPHGGSMNGLFRLVHGDELSLSEHMAIDTLDGRPVMRVKHFSNEFEAWEDKAESVDFRLLRAVPDTLFLEGLTIAREGPDALTYFLRVSAPDGSTRDEPIRLRRVDY